ncbi:MAG: DUF642 domain-containing protein, partial [Planctomycetota bacterium]|nr:DUF642 domain-containing protein [Planctomycetota bacterium]
MTTTLTNSTIATSLILLSLASSTSAQDAVQWRTEDGGNGHWYAFRLLEADCEAEATAAAGMFGAHLATATSEDENLLMDSLIPDSEPGAYIGGFQVTGTEEDSLGWYWVTGEAWDYTAWDTNQPSGGSSEDCLFMYSLDYANASGWHDNVHFACGSDTLQRPYVIEWSADCNGDGIVDYGQILDGTLSDEDGNGVPDCCENGDCLNLVENGSFEQGPALNECSWHWIDVAGANAIPGWTVISESVARFRIDRDDAGCQERWRSFSGRHSLDLDGEGPGTIRTSIDTIPGEYYRLTFELTGNCDQAPNERGTAVTIGSTTRTFIHQCEFDGDEPWSTHAWMFRASDATTDIAFASLSNQGS